MEGTHPLMEGGGFNHVSGKYLCSFQHQGLVVRVDCEIPALANCLTPFHKTVKFGWIWNMHRLSPDCQSMEKVRLCSVKLFWLAVDHPECG